MRLYFVISATAFINLFLINAAIAKEVTINGQISLGSSLGLIFDGKSDYTYGGTTRNLRILQNGCPIKMGQIVNCKVRFKANGNSVEAILSAKSPNFGGTQINRPGSIFDAFICDQKSSVSYRANSGCVHFDQAMVQVLNFNKDIAQLKYNGQIMYAFAQRVTINCQGTSVSLPSYIGRNFPPGIQSC
jgi:hypothetical protein